MKKRKFAPHQFVKKSWIRVNLGVYWFWAALRVFLTLLPQTGYIHPDEYFQTAEVAAGDVFRSEVSLPWEYNSSNPIRSIPFIYATVHCPLMLTKILVQFIEFYLGVSLLTPYVLVISERLAMCILSFLSDYCLFKICYLYGQNYKQRLTLFASSFVSIVFMTRTFTNTLEAACFNFLLYLVASCMAESEKINYQNGYLKDKYKEANTIADQVKITKLIRLLPKHSLRRCMRITCVTVCGFFNRPTFLLFAATPLFYWFQRGLSATSTFKKDFHVRILVFLVYCCPVFCFFIFCDSAYYGYLTWGEILTYRVNFNNFVLTPFNFLRYNFDSANLAKHGLHPRFLHILINVPLLFNVLGISGLVVLFKMFYRGSFSHWTLLPKSQSITGMMTLSVIVPMAGLSLFPHQEPRFITPLLAPLVFLYAHLVVDFDEDCTTVAPFRKRYPVQRRLTGAFRLPLKCLSYIEKATDRFDNRYNIYGRYLSNLKNDIVTTDDNGTKFEAKQEEPVVTADSPVKKPLQQSVLLKLWYLCNILCVIFFGFLHQGGVYSLSKYLHKELQTLPKYTTIHLVTSHTYSIPFHLLNIKSNYQTKSSHFQAYELGTENFENIHLKLISVLQMAKEKKEARRRQFQVLYALPSSVYHEFTHSHRFYNANYTYTVVELFYPHFSSEALPNVFLNVTSEPFNMNSESLWLELTNSYAVQYFTTFIRQFGLMLVNVELIEL